MFFYAVILGMFAVIFVNYLTDTGMLFSWFRSYLENELSEKIVPMWMYKIFTCSICMSGQLALWFYIIKYWHAYQPLEHFCFIVVSLFTAIYILNRVENY